MAFSFSMPKGVKGKSPSAGDGADSMDMTSMEPASGEGGTGEEGSEPADEKANEKQLGASFGAAVKAGDGSAIYEAFAKLMDACK